VFILTANLAVPKQFHDNARVHAFPRQPLHPRLAALFALGEVADGNSRALGAGRPERRNQRAHGKPEEHRSSFRFGTAGGIGRSAGPFSYFRNTGATVGV
jgi:hypothetical protein